MLCPQQDASAKEMAKKSVSNSSSISIIGRATKVQPLRDNFTGGLLEKLNLQITEETEAFKKTLLGEQISPILFLFMVSGALPITKTLFGKPSSLD